MFLNVLWNLQLVMLLVYMWRLMLIPVLLSIVVYSKFANTNCKSGSWSGIEATWWHAGETFTANSPVWTWRPCCSVGCETFSLVLL